MRILALLPAALAALAAASCSSAPPGAGKLTLNDPYWREVNVEIVITRRADCDSRDEGFISTQKIVMYKDTTQSFAVPSDAMLCWRHDRDPDHPSPGAWSSWTKATLYPGQSAETDL
jgi:hypothetical protein